MAQLTKSEGLSIDETSLLFGEGFGVRKAKQMLAEKQELSKRFRHESQGVWSSMIKQALWIGAWNDGEALFMMWWIGRTAFIDDEQEAQLL
jgi:transposase